MTTQDDKLHALARHIADGLIDPDRKQLRFNDIVATARSHYLRNVEAGVIELVEACDRSSPELYVKGAPMWQVLNQQYAWMTPNLDAQAGKG